MPTIHTSPLTLPWASLAEVPGLSETVRGRRSRLRKQGKQGVPGHKQEREREWTREKERSFLFFGDWDGDEFESFVWDVFSSMFHPQSLRYIIPSQLTCQSVDT